MQGCIIIAVIAMESDNAKGFMMKEGWIQLAIGLVTTVVAVCVVVTCAIGGFVVVAQMIQ